MMNLKEAFRFQNKLQCFMTEAEGLLSRDANITKTEHEYFYSKVDKDAQNQKVESEPTTDYAGKITQMTAFLLWLLEQREVLAKSIREAKDKLSIDMDAEVSLNKNRQHIAQIFLHMTQLRSSEVVRPNAGTGYRFNAEGNQVSYKCDMKTVTTIDFDRDKVRKHLVALNKQIDAASAELDRCLVNGEVIYEAPFDVNDSFADVFAWFADRKAE